MTWQPPQHPQHPGTGRVACLMCGAHSVSHELVTPTCSCCGSRRLLPVSDVEAYHRRRRVLKQRLEQRRPVAGGVSGERLAGTPTPVSDQPPQPPDTAPGDEAPPGTTGTGQDVCPDCDGTGLVGTAVCATCQGRGWVTEAVGGG
ncbi:hypothetical protein [Baekduia soli]|uniref:hypothetical protein n=1 Tax=Baekduia soli TaxID=496014 RepID=UPI001E32E654|nr:hypothetical protein [Baekduia soli]